MNPVNGSHRNTLLSTAKAIGRKYKNQLLQFKPLILTLNEEPGLHEVTTGILDFLEDRR